MTISELKKDARDEMYGLGLYRSRNAKAVYDFFDALIDRAAKAERERCAKIVGVHDSPHAAANCRLCRIEGGL